MIGSAFAMRLRAKTATIQKVAAATAETTVRPPTPTSRAMRALVFALRAQNMRVTVQGLMDRQGAAHITAPENENTLLTMDAAKAMKEMPKTMDKSNLNPPLMSSLFIIKITPQRAIATMEIHLPAGPVMVFTTCSRGLENSVMPPDAEAMEALI